MICDCVLCVVCEGSDGGVGVELWIEKETRGPPSSPSHYYLEPDSESLHLYAQSIDLLGRIICKYLYCKMGGRWVLNGVPCRCICSSGPCVSVRLLSRTFRDLCQLPFPSGTRS